MAEVENFEELGVSRKAVFPFDGAGSDDHSRSSPRALATFYKNATRGFLPPETIAKTKHGFGLPFGVWTRTHPGLRRMSETALDSLAARGVFRRNFLDETLRLHREGHAAYYGELVWVLTALELWLDARGGMAAP